jgi:hypothetical protein
MPSSGSLAPHVPQNVASCRFFSPQARQTLDRRSFAPHVLQKRSSSRFMRPHDRQSIIPSPLTSPPVSYHWNWHPRRWGVTRRGRRPHLQRCVPANRTPVIACDRGDRCRRCVRSFSGVVRQQVCPDLIRHPTLPPVGQRAGARQPVESEAGGFRTFHAQDRIAPARSPPNHSAR